MASSNNYAPPPGLGSLYAFGPNAAGVTARNTADGTTLSPTAAVDPHDYWVQVCVARGGTGTPFAMGLLSDGTLWGWGSNASGSSVGTGSIGQGNNNNPYYVPTKVGSAKDWAYIGAAVYGGFGIKTDGTLWSWGYDIVGELGQGVGSSTYTPTQIGTGFDWARAYGAGLNGTSAKSFLIKTDGTLWALGANDGYGTGLGINTGAQTSPTMVGSITDDWLMVCVGDSTCLGIKTNGTLWCWGTDRNGNSLQGSSGGVYTTPTQVGSATDWAFVATMGGGLGCTMAIKTNGTLWTAGSNSSYMTGLGINSGSTITVTQLTSATNWSAVFPLLSGGGGRAWVGLKTDGTVWSWGDNADGQTGQGVSTGFTTTPTQVGTDADWAAIPTVGGTGRSVVLIKSV